MHVLELESTEAFVVFDIDDVPCAGGTRLATDVDRREVSLLARAMTYKFATMGLKVGGAKAGIRVDAAGRQDAIANYCKEIGPLLESGAYRTASDLGTTAEDFIGLPGHEVGPDRVSLAHGATLDAYATGFGVVVAAEATLGGLGDRGFAIEGFGKAGSSAAQEVSKRGGRVVAVSTVDGCVVDEKGLDIDALLAERDEHGDSWMRHYAGQLLAPAALFEQSCDVLIPGARIGAIDTRTAGRVQAGVIAPAANVPYSSGALDVLRDRSVIALADFVCNAGAVICHRAATNAPAAALVLVEETIGALSEAFAHDPRGPFEAACATAREFLDSWVDPAQLPRRAPLADAVL